MLTRREFLSIAPLASLAPALSASEPTAVRFGLIADVHEDVMPDGRARVAAFADAMNKLQVNFICQLGDLCTPRPANLPCMAALAGFKGDAYHVLGNHDMDGGFTREKAVAFFGMPARYYAFVRGGVRFIVLDGNDPGGKGKGYKRLVAKDQLDWLKKELCAAEPAIVMIHQSLDRPDGVENQDEVRGILKAANADTKKVLAVFSGHHHMNYASTIDGISHIQINSASYHWVGEKLAHTSYDADTHKRCASLKYTCPYRDALWAVVTVDLMQKKLTIEGRSTGWVGKSPWEAGATKETHDPKWIEPVVSSREIVFA